MSPTIHLNGTSREELLRQVCDAVAAVRTAIGALVDMSPNGRDYYPQGSDAINLAVKEHHARLEKLRAVQDELNAMAESIADAA